ncbi:retrotransposon gag protein, partial [Trifolium medium]|nr:retrotransposon gag protein [Trifolium medium]
MDKSYSEAYQLIESMAQNHYQRGSERTPVEKPQTKGSMYEISGIDHVNAKLYALTQKIESLTTTPTATVAATTQNCEICGVQGHVIAECQLLTGVSPDQVNYTQGNSYSNSYNQGLKNHLYLSYKSDNALYAPSQAPSSAPPGFQNTAYPAQNAPRKSNLEIIMENFIAAQAQTNKDVL